MTGYAGMLRDETRKTLRAMFGGSFSRYRGRRGHEGSAVGAYMIERGAAEGREVSVLKVIKLVYFAHGWMLGLHGRPLVRDTVMAFRYGPAMLELYRKVKHFGGNAVPVGALQATAGAFNGDELDVMEQVWEKYGRLTALHLSTLAHGPDTPWRFTWDHGGGKPSSMGNDSIEDYFVRLYREAEQEEAGGNELATVAC